MLNTVKERPYELYRCFTIAGSVAAVEQGYYYGKCRLELSNTRTKRHCFFVPISALTEAAKTILYPNKKSRILFRYIDVISPNVCAKKGFRDDGKGFYKTLTFAVAGLDCVSISSTIQAAVKDIQGNIVPDTESGTSNLVVQVKNKEVINMVALVNLSYKTYIATQSRKRTKGRNEYGLDIIHI